MDKRVSIRTDGCNENFGWAGPRKGGLSVVVSLFGFMSGPPAVQYLSIDAILVDLNGDVGGLLVQVNAEIIEVFLGNRPGGGARIALLIADVLEVILLKELVLIGWAGGLSDFECKTDDGDGGAEGRAFRGAVEVILEEIQGRREEGAEAVGVIEPERFAPAIEFGLEEGVI
jgi:hypothetical protein